ncbi:MAG: protein-L-isoaspartate(D-aspartate) O-methyltransferase [Pseudomonadota bacterium]
MSPSAEKSTTRERLAAFLLRLRGNGILDAGLLKAVEATPLGDFVPIEQQGLVWSDRPLPLPVGQMMHSPDLVVEMVQALDLTPNYSVLEIGTGSGFQTALLARLSKKVHSIDRYQTLLDSARQRTERLGLANITFAKADGMSADMSDVLYDRIIADVAFPTIPRHLLDRLAAGGVAIAVIGEAGSEQSLVKLTKIGSRFEREDLRSVRFCAIEHGVASSL